MLLEVIGGCEECVHDSGVLQVVESLPHKPAHVSELVDVRAFQAAEVGEQALAARGYLGIGKHQFSIHALEHVGRRLAHALAVEPDDFQDAREVREAAAVVRAQDALVGHAELLEDVHHVIPALERQKRAALCERFGLLRRLLAIAVVLLVGVKDAIGLAERLDEERVVRPARAGDLAEANALVKQVLLAIDCRPDGRVMAQQMRRVLNGERLDGRVDASVVAAVHLALLGRVGQPDAPITRLYDVDRLGVHAREREQVGIHAALDPVVGFEDGNPLAVRLVEPAVTGGAVALVVLVDHHDAFVARGMGAHDVKRVVGGAVIQADDLQVLVRLSLDAVERLIEVGSCVVDGDDDGNQRCELRR